MKWTDREILDTLAKRIEEYRRNPGGHRLNATAMEQDSLTRSIYHAARKRDRSESPDWWAQWLVRAGMSHEEAIRASRPFPRHDYSRKRVLGELVELYRDATRDGQRLIRELELDPGLSWRAKRAFGSVEAAYGAARRALELAKPNVEKTPSPGRRRKRKQPPSLDANPYEAELVTTLGRWMARQLPIDEWRGALARVSFRAVAAELGLKGWRTQSSKSVAVERLAIQALRQGPDVLGRLVRMVVKRVVRHRRRRDGWCWNRWYARGTKEPIWREEVEEILAILARGGIRPLDLQDERFLKGLPRRLEHVTALSRAETLESLEGRVQKGREAAEPARTVERIGQAVVHTKAPGAAVGWAPTA